MLRKNQIEAFVSMRCCDHALKKKGIEQIFEIPKRRITPHAPGAEFMQMYFETFPQLLGFRHVWTEKMNLVTATDKFLDEINCLSRPATSGREERFMSQESDFHSSSTVVRDRSTVGYCTAPNSRSKGAR